MNLAKPQESQNKKSQIYFLYQQWTIKKYNLNKPHHLPEHQKYDTQKEKFNRIFA